MRGVCVYVCACMCVHACQCMHTCICVCVHRMMNQLTVGHDEAQKRLNSVFGPTYRKRGRKKKGQKGREGKLKRKRETEKKATFHILFWKQPFCRDAGEMGSGLVRDIGEGHPGNRTIMPCADCDGQHKKEYTAKQSV